MKNFRVLILTILFAFSFVQNTQATVGAGMWVAGASQAGKVALAGLDVFGGGVAFTYFACGGIEGEGTCAVVLFLTAFVLGAILLDEEGHPEFQEMSFEDAHKFEVTKKEVEIYNSEIVEANMLFNEVSSQLTNDSEVEEARNLWDEMKEFVSPETFKVMKKLAQTK